MKTIISIKPHVNPDHLVCDIKTKERYSDTLGGENYRDIYDVMKKVDGYFTYLGVLFEYDMDGYGEGASPADDTFINNEGIPLDVFYANHN